MTAVLTARHTVADFGAWHVVYTSLDPLRAEHGCTADHVYHLPGEPLDVFVVHQFPTLAQAQAFAGDPALATAMKSGGVVSAPRIEIFEGA